MVRKLKARSHCPLHKKHELMKYCTCKHSVCERCLSADHQEHSVQVIEEATDKLRSQLQQFVAKDGAAGSGESGAVSSKLLALFADTEAIKESAKATSEVVVESMQEMRKTVDLIEVDGSCWKLLEPAEELQQRLCFLQQKELTGVELVRSTSKYVLKRG